MERRPQFLSRQAQQTEQRQRMEVHHTANTFTSAGDRAVELMDVIQNGTPWQQSQARREFALLSAALRKEVAKLNNPKDPSKG